MHMDFLCRWLSTYNFRITNHWMEIYEIKKYGSYNALPISLKVFEQIKSFFSISLILSCFQVNHQQMRLLRWAIQRVVFCLVLDSNSCSNHHIHHILSHSHTPTRNHVLYYSCIDSRMVDMDCMNLVLHDSLESRLPSGRELVVHSNPPASENYYLYNEVIFCYLHLPHFGQRL